MPIYGPIGVARVAYCSYVDWTYWLDNRPALMIDARPGRVAGLGGTDRYQKATRR